MTSFKNTLVGASAALIALVSLVLPIAPVFAADLGLDGGWDTDYYTDYSSPSYDSYDSYGGWDTDYYTDYSSPSYDDYGGWDTDYYTDYANPSYSSYGGSSFGSGSSFSMPTFGSANYSYRTAYDYPVFSTPSKSSSNTTVNTCTNNSCNDTYSYVDNSIVDNSVKISNSFNNQNKKKQQYNDCYDYGYSQYEYGYGQEGYNYGSYNYDGRCYTYAAPIAYNTTPYISLSQTPYTGLDLGPMGEVLYWTFLVLWCLGATYLIVVKRVQNKLVSFLNSFLFGSTALTTGGTKVVHAAHTTHAPVHTVAPAPLVEEGIDPFIQSQIKRS